MRRFDPVCEWFGFKNMSAAAAGKNDVRCPKKLIPEATVLSEKNTQKTIFWNLRGFRLDGP